MGVCIGVGVRLSGVRAHVPTPGGAPKLVLGPVDLTIKPGEKIAIVGPSGTGKTTLLRLIAGLLKPSDGSIAYDTNQRDAVSIGYAPQTPSLLPWLGVLDNVLLPARLGPRPMTPPMETARRLLEHFGLAGLEDLRPHALSGGMQSRAALARALIVNPHLLLLDEPFGSLDEVTAEGILVRLAPLLATRTAVIVSHSLSQAAFLADRFVICSPAPAAIVGEVTVAAPQPRERPFLRSPALLQAVDAVHRIMRGASL